jgi:hypothetical protein
LPLLLTVVFVRDQRSCANADPQAAEETSQNGFVLRFGMHYFWCKE